MAKKNNKKDKESKKARTEAKNKKAQAKADVKDKKKAKKMGDEDEDDLDIETVLAQYKQQQEEFEAVHTEIVTRPGRRINCAMCANPTHGKRELFIFGGENTVDGVSAFYNDLFTYSLDSDQWRKITSKNSPMHRSSSAIAAHPSGIILIHGGEFSSPKQNTFYHYSDTWLLDASNKEWTKIEQKNGPSARSGHRITVWKNYFILSGGFRDLGGSTTYLNDLWVFDITTYKWKQIEFPQNHTVPDARSGHSFLPHADGAVLWGGYCKVKAGKGLQKGKILSDCWLLKMKSDLSAIRWERRRKQGFQPSARVGCSMVHHKGRGVLFGGVYDFEETEESLDSQFFNDLYTYSMEMNRWYSLQLRALKKRQEKVKKQNRDEDLEEILNALLKKANLEDDDDADGAEIENELRKMEDEEEEEHENQYEVRTQMPHPRFNASTAVVDDTLFIFGGVWEFGEKDYSIDSLYSIDLGKLDGMRVYWEDLKDVERAKAEGDEDEDEDDFEDEDDEEDDDDDENEDIDRKLVAEEEEEEEEEEIIEDEPEIPDPRPWLPHPKAFESLRAFYVRTGAQFLEWAISNNRDARGKHLKKHAFDLCQDRWWERREQVRIEEDKLEETGVGEVIERDTSKTTKRR
jgi:N-acetylneuraminic acid mutarotase